MNFRRMFGFLFLFALATFGGALDMSAQGTLGSLKPHGKQITLLNGHLTVHVPDAAVIAPREHDVMAAAESNEEETRVVIDAKEERLVIMAYELFQTAETRFDERAQNYLDGYRERLGELVVESVRPERSSIRVLSFRPVKVDPHAEAVFLSGLLVAHPDGTVQELRFFVNPEGAKDLAGARRLVDSIAASVSMGSRNINMRGGASVIDRGQKSELRLLLPERGILYKQDGEDFTVYNIRFLAPLNTLRGSMGIYVGHHPSPMHEQFDTTRIKKKQEERSILDMESDWTISWFEREEMQDVVTTEETILKHPTDSDLYLHIFYTATTGDDLKLMRQIASSLALP